MSSVGSAIGSAFNSVKSFLTDAVPSITGSGKATTGLGNVLSSVNPLAIKSAGGDNPASMVGVRPDGTYTQAFTGSGGVAAVKVPSTPQNNALATKQQGLYNTAQQNVAPKPIVMPVPRTLNPYTPSGSGAGSGSGSGYDPYAASRQGAGSGIAPGLPNGGLTATFGPIAQPLFGESGAQGQGYSGEFGFGGGGAFQASSGSPGAGGSAYTGTLGGASGLGTPFAGVGSPPNEKERLEQERRQGKTQTAPPFVPFEGYGLPPGWKASSTPQGGSAATDPYGNTYIPQNGGFTLATQLPGQLGMQTNAQGQGVISPLAVPTVNLKTAPVPAANATFRAALPSGPIDMAQIQNRTLEIAQIMNSGMPLTAADRTKFYDELEGLRQQTLQAKLAEDPLTSGPHMQETPEQFQFLNTLPPEQQGIRGLFDRKAQELGLPNLNADIVKTQKELQASEEIFQKIIKDIEENPDLPKGLARRRIEDFTKKNGLVIKNLQGKLGILQQQKDFANEALNREFNIIQLEQNQNERNRAAAMDRLNMFISSGGIGNFSEQDLLQAAQLTGIPASQLQAIRNAVAGKQKAYAQFSVQTDNDGNVTILGIRPDGRVEQLGGAAGVGQTKNVGELDYRTAAQVENLRNQFQNYPIVKNFNDVQNKAISVQNIIDAGVGGPGDLALVYEFMKALDPTSVVRETEYDSAAKSGNIFAGVFAQFNGYLKPQGGFLPANVKDAFANLINIKYDAVSRQYQNYFDETARLINRATGQQDGGDYLPRFGAVTGMQSSGPTGGGGNQTVSFDSWADF